MNLFITFYFCIHCILLAVSGIQLNVVFTTYFLSLLSFIDTYFCIIILLSVTQYLFILIFYILSLFSSSFWWHNVNLLNADVMSQYNKDCLTSVPRCVVIVSLHLPVSDPRASSFVFHPLFLMTLFTLLSDCCGTN